MGDRYDIGFDAAKGEDRGVRVYIKSEQDGIFKYGKVVNWDTPLDSSDLRDRVKYEIERKPYTTSIEVHRTDSLLRLLLEHRAASQYLLEKISSMGKGRRRKTTYKTIRRHCAKRNR